MRKRGMRMKATDVFMAHPPWLGTTTDFSKSFPNIRDLTLRITEHGDEITGGSKESIYTLSSPPGEYVNCSNPRCYNGGIRIGQWLRFITEDTKTRETLLCQGYEGSPKGRRRDGPCDNYFDVHLIAKARTPE